MGPRNNPERHGSGSGSGGEQLSERERKKLIESVQTLIEASSCLSEEQFKALCEYVDSKDPQRFNELLQKLPSDLPFKDLRRYMKAVEVVQDAHERLSDDEYDAIINAAKASNPVPNNGSATNGGAPTPPTPPPAPNPNPAPTNPTNPNPAPTNPAPQNPPQGGGDPSVGDIPLPPDDAPLVAGLVNQDEDLLAKARFAGENRLASELEEGNIFTKAVKKIWKGGIFRNLYRQKYINEARRDMLQAQNMVLDFDEKDRRRFNRDICSAFVSETEGVIDESKGDQRKSLLEEHPEMHARVKEIVSKYASGEIATIAEAERQFRDAVKDLENGKFSGDKHLSISNISDIAIEAKRRYDNMITVAEAMNGRIEHDEALARVMAGFDLKYGQRRIDRLDPHYNKVDKIVDKIQHSKIGAVVSPETIGIACGVAACVTEMAGKRIPGLIFTLPGVGAAITSAFRAGSDFEKDRARALYDSRYSREFDGDQKRRKEMMATMHEHHKANEVREDLKSRIQSIQEAKNRGDDTSAMEKELLQAVARCKAYLDLDKTGTSVLSYTTEVNAPSEQLYLLEQLGAAKALLRNGGITDLDDQLKDSSDLMKDTMQMIDGNLEDAEHRKRKAKVKRIVKRAGFSLAAGMISGAVVQEFRALNDPNTQGLFEKDTGNYGTRLTTGKKLAAMLTGKDKVSPDMQGHYDINTGAITENSGSMDFVKASDGTYSLVDGNGKTVAEGLDWNSKTGFMTADSIKKLNEQGITVKNTGSLSEKIPINTTKETSVTKSLSEWAKEHCPAVHRKFWYDNDTPNKFDLNELRTYNYVDESGNPGFIVDMSDTGSFHSGDSAIFSELAKEGKISLFISPTDETQGNPIEVIGKLLPDGRMAFCPKPGDAAAKYFEKVGGDSNFLGKFGEIAQDLGLDENGEKIIAPLSTVVGPGDGGDITDIISIPVTEYADVSVPEYLFEFAGHGFEMPMILPFTAEGAMNASKHGLPTRRSQEIGYGDYGYGYGYGYGQGYGEPGYGNPGYGNPDGGNGYNNPGYNGGNPPGGNPSGGEGGGGYGGSSYERQPINRGLGTLSPSIEQGKALNLGNEVSWYEQQMRQKAEPGYVDQLRKEVDSSPELKSIDNNIKTIVTIPVHGPSETDNIYRTLSLYAQQENVDPGSFMIVLDLNASQENVDKMPDWDTKMKATRDRIEQARRDFPNLKIAVIEQVGHGGIGDVARNMNDATMLAINDAIQSGRMDSNNDVLIVRNDADIRHMNKNYISSYQKAARENPKTPLFSGTSYFDVNRQHEAPGFGATQVIERINNLLHAVNGRIHTAGGNYAYRASHYAAANGYGFESEGIKHSNLATSDDLEIGYRISDAFRDPFIDRVDGSTDPNNDEIMDPSTRMIVRVGEATMDLDDNRQAFYYREGLEHRGYHTSADAYGKDGYNKNPIRPTAVTGFIEDINDKQRFNDVAEQFERELTDFSTFEGGNSPVLQNALSWLFDVPANSLDSYYRIAPNPANGGRTMQFTLTDDGRQKLREALLNRFGDGLSTDVRNSLQQAIADGKWGTPLPNPAP